MEIFLEKSDSTIRIRTEIQSSEPKAVAHQVQYHSRNHVWSEMGVPDWQATICPTTGKQTLSVELTSVWAADAVQIWAKELARNIGFFVKIEAPPVPDCCADKAQNKDPLYENITWFFQGEPLDSLESLSTLLSFGEKDFALGAFSVQSGEMHVSDPCYEKDICCSFSLPVTNGQWNARCTIGSTSWLTRVKRLQVWHESVSEAVFDALDSFEVVGSADVDSAQLGFFDKGKYPDSQDDPQFDAFYDACGEITCSERGYKAGVPVGFEFGVVSLPGFGDGGYEIYALKNEQGLAVALSGVFIGEKNSTDDGSAD